jgi:four helix bundle protein
VSVPSNLAEGSARNSKREFAYFISNARGSLAEIETQIELAVCLDYIPESSAKTVLERIATLGRLLTGLRDWSAGSRIVRNKEPETSNKKSL